MTKASRKAAKIAGTAAAPSTATWAAIRKPQKTTAHVSVTANSTVATSVKRSKTDITPKVMHAATEIIGIATTTTTVIRIASAAARMVTATSGARSSCVK